MIAVDLFIWSAITCYRFSRSRLVATRFKQLPRQAAAYQSGDKSPHCKVPGAEPQRNTVTSSLVFWLAVPIRHRAERKELTPISHLVHATVIPLSYKPFLKFPVSDNL